MSNIKEEFCGICTAIPIALAGLGGTAYAASGEDEKRKKIIILIGCSIVLVVSIYFLIKYSKCSACSI